MKAIILSYNPGMFGEFLAAKIKKSSDQFAPLKEVKVTLENRFLYPNYLSQIGVDCKNLPMDTKWPITDTDMFFLESQYKDKTICLPTHWYSDSVTDSNIPSSIGIRLFSDDMTIITLAYCMYWIKSHVYSDTAWDSRRQEITSMIENNHRFSEELKKLLEPENYQNWKFLAYKNNYLVDGVANLQFYLTIRYRDYIKWSSQSFKNSKNWHYIDAGKLIYLDNSEVEKLEGIVEGQLDRADIENYAKKNEEVLKEKLGLSLNDLTGSNWIQILYEYAADHLLIKPS